MLSAGMATLGEVVKELREQAGIRTQGDLAKKMGVPQPRASDLENDRYHWKDVRLRTLFALAKALGVSVERLVRDLDEDYQRLGLTGSVSEESTNRGTGGPDAADSTIGTKHAGSRSTLQRKAANAPTRVEESLAAENARLRGVLRQISDSAGLIATLAERNSDEGGAAVDRAKPGSRGPHRRGRK